MMLDRDKITFWTRLGAIALAVIFVGSFVFMGIGTDINYNLFDLLNDGSGAKEEKEQKEQKNDSREQMAQAEQELEEDPENPRVIKRLAGLYIQNGRTDEAERQAAYRQAGDAYAAAAEIQGDRPRPTAQAYLAAGQAYEQAGEQSKAIQYWNEYLKLEPEGEQADAVKERIQGLLKGEEQTGATEGAKKK